MTGNVLYDVRLMIGADYPDTVKEARHVLRMRPRRSRRQHVHAEALSISPTPDERRSITDFFGNACDQVSVLKQHETMEVELRARIEVEPATPALSGTPSPAEIVRAAIASRETGATSPIHFRGPSRLLAPSTASRAFGKGFAGRGSVGETVLAMTKAIKSDFAYVSGETEIDTPVDEVLRTRRGVCQDFAHLMIVALRGLGLPAAYVSGFLRTDPPPGQPRLEGADAMHAWVAAWLGDDLGWIGFDPTNGVLAGTDHITVAFGRDYADVAPMGGVVTTSGGQETRHEVDVVPVAPVRYDEAPASEDAASAAAESGGD